ncbi:MAG: hypothetical protein IPO08_22030 [Xanthomonadales bacterium]|nr:hypothetical protein [Xanthomonadales bacterium]
MPTIEELANTAPQDLLAVTLVLGGGVVALIWLFDLVRMYVRHKLRR